MMHPLPISLTSIRLRSGPSPLDAHPVPARSNDKQPILPKELLGLVIDHFMDDWRAENIDGWDHTSPRKSSSQISCIPLLVTSSTCEEFVIPHLYHTLHLHRDSHLEKLLFEADGRSYKHIRKLVCVSLGEKKVDETPIKDDETQKKVGSVKSLVQRFLSAWEMDRVAVRMGFKEEIEESEVEKVKFRGRMLGGPEGAVEVVLPGGSENDWHFILELLRKPKLVLPGFRLKPAHPKGHPIASGFLARCSSVRWTYGHFRKYDSNVQATQSGNLIEAFNMSTCSITSIYITWDFTSPEVLLDFEVSDTDGDLTETVILSNREISLIGKPKEGRRFRKWLDIFSIFAESNVSIEAAVLDHPHVFCSGKEPISVTEEEDSDDSSSGKRRWENVRLRKCQTLCPKSKSREPNWDTLKDLLETAQTDAEKQRLEKKFGSPRSAKVWNVKKGLE